GCVGTAGSIQAAIDAAPSGGEVVVCPGTYAERLVLSGKSLTLRSRDGAAATVLDAGGRGKALSVTSNAYVVVEGFTFRNGVSAWIGGDVSCDGSWFFLGDSVVEGGSADMGGGVGANGCYG